MTQNIIAYLNENKEKYPKEVLIAELRKSGYSEEDIAEGVGQVFEGKAPMLAPANTSFWNFKDKKVYTSAGQKWADFLFGVFAPSVFWFTSLLIFSFISYGISYIYFVPFLIDIAIAVYLFNRRRFIFYGLLASLVFVPIIFTIFIFLAFSSGGF
jgi:hypothetical protein